MKYDDNELRPAKKRRSVEGAPAIYGREAVPRASRPAKKRPASAGDPRSASSASGASKAPRRHPAEDGVPAKQRVPRDPDAATYRASTAESRQRTASRAKASARPVDDPYDPPRKRAKARDADYLYADDEYEIRPPRGASQKKRKKGRKKGKPERSGFLNTLFYCVIAIILALVVSLVLKSTTLEVVRVSGDSMYKTLAEGDVVLCTKFDYKSRGTEPERKAVVLVHGQSGVMFRRVVGLPGETVEIADTGDVIIDSLALPESYVEIQSYNAYPEKSVDPGHYYVLCDNRSVTADSREYGPVKKNEISRARFVIWPLNRIGQIKVG